MKQTFQKFLKRCAIAAAMLIIAAVILWFSVMAGIKIFGVTAFAVPDITEPCGMTAEELGERLKYDLKPYAQAFIYAEEDYEINACFLASIAALESGWGRNQFRKNNIFGFGKKEFDSVEHCIDYVAWFLRKNYINEDGRYFNGATIEGISVCYCDAEWAKLVRNIYLNFYGEYKK